MKKYSWHSVQWSTVQQALNEHRLPHGLLLHGPEGVGKLHFAQLFAQLLLCEHADTSEMMPCGQCRSCHLLLVGTHPDFFEIKLLEKSRVIKVDQIRGLVTQLSSTSQLGGYQVVVINPADKMNIAAANAFLKTLEEPPGEVVFLLVCHQLGALPMTVRSRCQRIVFHAASEDLALPWLRANLSDPSQAELLLRLSLAAPLRALQFSENDFLSFRQQLFTQLGSLLQRKMPVTTVVAEWVKLDVVMVLQILLTCWQDILRLRFAVMDDQLVHRDCIAMLQNWAQMLETITVQQFYDRTLAALRLMTSPMNPNVPLLLENIFIKE